MKQRILTILAICLLVAWLCISLPALAYFLGPIYDGPELDYQPAILRMQPSGVLMLVFERINPANFFGDFYVTFSNDNGETWTTPQAIIASAENERHPSLVQLGPDSYALFYLKDETGSGAYRLYRATSSDGLTWDEQGSLDLGWPTPGEINPCVIREADGRLTMTYHRFSGPVYIALSYDDGVTWDTLKTQVSPGNAQLPRLAKREGDNLFVVTYQVGGSNLDIFSKVSNDPHNWSGPQYDFSTMYNSHDSQPIVLEDGTFMVPYAMAVGGYFDVYYRTSRDGMNWSEAERYTFDVARYDTQPHPLLQGTPGRVILAWPHQDGPTPYQDHDVWVDNFLLIPADLSASQKGLTPAMVQPDGVITSTILLSNVGLGPTGAHLTDTIPLNTAYQMGSLWASRGVYGYDPVGEVITWTGVISTQAEVMVTFRLEVDPELPDGTLIENSAEVRDDNTGAVTLLDASASVDAADPVSTVLDPTPGQLISGITCLVSGVASDTVSGIAGVSVSVDGGEWQPATGMEEWVFLWQNYTEGEHQIRTRATDLVGHVEVAGAGVTVTVDTTPPTAMILDPVAGQAISQTTYLVHGVASDTVTIVEGVLVSIDGGGWQMASGSDDWTYTWEGYSDGEHSIRARAVDAAGNTGLSGLGITVSVDRVAPILVGFSPLSGSVEVPLTATLILTFSEPVLSSTLVFATTPDPGGWAVSWSSEGRVASLEHDGLIPNQTYTVEVAQARDRARNPLTPVTWKFTTQSQVVVYRQFLPLVKNP